MTEAHLCYDNDFYAWTQHQAAVLREGAYHELDIEHLAEEIESLGKRDRRELGSRLQVLVMHLLKWAYQPEGRGPSWRRTIRTQRLEIDDLLSDSPSLRPRVSALMAQRYLRCIMDAAEEMGLSETVFPPQCPWMVDEVLDESFWPE
jgi:hypothetical protein